MEKKCKMIGLLDTTGYESDQRVYSRGGCSKALKAGNALTQVIRKYVEKNGSNRTDGQFKRPHV